MRKKLFFCNWRDQDNERNFLESSIVESGSPWRLPSTLAWASSINSKPWRANLCPSKSSKSRPGSGRRGQSAESYFANLNIKQKECMGLSKMPCTKKKKKIWSRSKQNHDGFLEWHDAFVLIGRRAVFWKENAVLLLITVVCRPTLRGWLWRVGIKIDCSVVKRGLLCCECEWQLAKHLGHHPATISICKWLSPPRGELRILTHFFSSALTSGCGSEQNCRVHLQMLHT